MNKLLIGLLATSMFMACDPGLQDAPRNPDTVYNLSNEPLDVVFVAHAKDQQALSFAIDGVKENVKNLRRVIVVSASKLSDKAEWFDEAKYPFAKPDIATELFKGDSLRGTAYLSEKGNRIGWVYQQLLKLYAQSVIPGVSSNILIVDADTIFLKPIDFMTPEGSPYFNPATEYHKPYFEHAARLLPGFKKMFANHSGVAHHMLFQKEVLNDLFSKVESTHNLPMWKAMCRLVDPKELPGSSMSEYEIYFNYIFSKTHQATLRPLKWGNFVFEPGIITRLKSEGYDYASFHSWMQLPNG